MANKTKPGISIPKEKQIAMPIATPAAAKNRRKSFLLVSVVFGLSKRLCIRCKSPQVKKGRIIAPIQLGMPGIFLSWNK